MNTALKAFLTIAVSSGFLLGVTPSTAQNYPARPLTLVIGAGTGGASDIFARAFAEGLSKDLGQSVVVDNKPGAGGLIAAEHVKRAAPDGYTLHMTWIGNATSRGLNPKATFDVTKDFAHVSLMMYGSNILAVNPSTGFKTVQDLVAFAKKNPGKLSYASSGNGTSGHLAMELLKQRAGIDMLHIPYKTGAQAITDVVGGVLPLMFNNSDVVLPHMQSGKLTGLAITTPKRSPIAPNLPTIAESGASGIAGLSEFEVTAWAGISVPVGTPKAVIDRLHLATAKTVQNAAFKSAQETKGGVVVGSSPEQFTSFVKQEVDMWTQVIRTANIQMD